MSTPPPPLPSLPRPVAVVVGALLVVAAALQVGAGAVNAASVGGDEISPVVFGDTSVLVSGPEPADVGVAERLWLFRGLAAGGTTALLLSLGVVLLALSDDGDEERWEGLRARALLGAAVLAAVVVATNVLCLYDAATSDEQGFFRPIGDSLALTALTLAAPSVMAAGVLLARARLTPPPPAFEDVEDDEA